MKISTFDLNLFVILNAIYTQGSLTKAADVVGITQPAVSNALSRLRVKFNDDLFLRTGSGMIPTQKTENMIADIQNALMLMQQSVDEPDEFNPSTSIRNFKISLADVSEGRVLPYLMEEIDKIAPNVSVGSFHYSRRDQVHALATNQLDFVVDPVIPRSNEVKSQKVFEDHFVVAHRKDHALTKLDRITIEDILSQRHLNISQRTKGPHIIDVELAKLGLERDIALRAQHFLIAPDVVRNSDIVLFCTQSFALRHQLDYVDIPAELPTMEYFLIWHASDDMDGAHIWMRNLLIEAYKNARGIE